MLHCVIVLYCMVVQYSIACYLMSGRPVRSTAGAQIIAPTTTTTTTTTTISNSHTNKGAAATHRRQQNQPLRSGSAAENRTFREFKDVVFEDVVFDNSRLDIDVTLQNNI